MGFDYYVDVCSAAVANFDINIDLSFYANFQQIYVFPFFHLQIHANVQMIYISTGMKADRI